jgi:hypothetical protein
VRIGGKKVLFRLGSVAAGVHIRSLRRCATSSSCVGYLIVQDVKLLDCAYVDFAVITYFLLLMYSLSCLGVLLKKIMFAK